MPESRATISEKKPPFETKELRRSLEIFLNTPFEGAKVGNYKWGVYAFFDYDGEPIYVGQTNERLRTRIRRHLTNQRTDAVAMSVLDPFEVFEIEVWPLPQFEHLVQKIEPDAVDAAKAHLNALEYQIFQKELGASKFRAVLNEKDPAPPSLPVPIPPSLRAQVVSEEVYMLRAHPDTRIARRALIISRLAQVIAERQVQVGLRRVLRVQAERLRSLAAERFDALGGEAAVEVKSGDEDDQNGTD